MQSFFTGLTCPKCDRVYSADVVQNLCECGSPLFAVYDLKGIASLISRNDLGFRAHSLWRYKELLPVADPANQVSLGEGFTPFIPSRRIGPSLGLESLIFKDESFNPTGSFKARGLSVAISKAIELGVKAISLPTAGNAGGAAAAYCARAGIECHVFMPEDTPEIFKTECMVYGAHVYQVKGTISDAGMEMRRRMQGWFDVSTMKEPYRVEGKKTMLYEIAHQLNWSLPDAIIFPTGGGTGIVAAHKAIGELRQLGWLRNARTPRLIAVQAEGCAPVVRAWKMGKDDTEPWETPDTLAYGLRVPNPLAGSLILRSIKETNGTAVAVKEEAIAEASRNLCSREGLYVAPEAAAAAAALPQLLHEKTIDKNEKIVLILTGTGLKYGSFLKK